VAVLEERGYVARGADPLDDRRKRLQGTALGLEVMRAGEAVFDDLRDTWKRKIGAKQLERLESDLAALVGASPVRVETPGWIAHSLDETT
jgi:DNA-binding MarR family transcriptional regulator